MGFKSDIEIAQETEMLPITQIAEKAGSSPKKKNCAIISGDCVQSSYCL